MKNMIVLILRVVSALILLQTLYFKFTAHPESVKLFTEIGMEPYGRLLIGALELVAALLLLIPASVIYGAILAAGLMAGAIIGHITQLGFEGDRLSLGLLAIAVFVGCVIIMVIRRRDLPIINNMWTSSDSE